MKRSRTTSLLLMGTAPLLFSACQREPVAQEGLYTSLETCYQATGDRSSCEQAFAEASRQAADQAPRYASQQACTQDWGEERCTEQRDSQGHSFVGPLMAGFFMSQMLNGRRGFNSAPAFQDRNRGWQRPTPGARPDTSNAFRTGNTAMTPINSTPNRAMTVSRGGFGARSAGRSSFGG